MDCLGVGRHGGITPPFLGREDHFPASLLSLVELAIQLQKL